MKLTRTEYIHVNDEDHLMCSEKCPHFQYMDGDRSGPDDYYNCKRWNTYLGDVTKGIPKRSKNCISAFRLKKRPLGGKADAGDS